VCVAFKVFVEYFECLRRERRATFSFLRRLTADEVRQVLHPVLVSFLRLSHPPLQYRLDLLSALRRYVELLKPGTRQQVAMSQ